eukprot:1941792-Pyramimonas_sp.AAC.1
MSWTGSKLSLSGCASSWARLRGGGGLGDGIADALDLGADAEAGDHVGAELRPLGPDKLEHLRAEARHEQENALGRLAVDHEDAARALGAPESRLVKKGDCQLGATLVFLAEDARALDRLEASASASHLEDGPTRARGPER